MHPTCLVNMRHRFAKLRAEHKVGIVDSYQLFRDYANDNGGFEDLMSQSNHPNLQGHSLVAAALADWFVSDE